MPAASCRAGPSPGPQGCPCVVTRECPSLIGGCHWEAGAHGPHLLSDVRAERLCRGPGLKCGTSMQRLPVAVG